MNDVTHLGIYDIPMISNIPELVYLAPVTKEEYYYREIFSNLFPSESAALAVPHEAGVACSTAKALEWDEAWSKMDEPSGRAISGVHNDAYKS